MKKIVIMFALYMVGCVAKVDESFFLTHQKNENNEINFTQAEKLIEEYNGDNECKDDIHEYDQHICDDAQSPQPSQMRLFFEKMAGKILIQYFFIKEKTRFYLEKLRNVFYKG